MQYTIEHIFYNIKTACLGWNRKRFDDVLENLLYAMRDKIGHPFIGDQYYNLTFFMNPPLYHEFCAASCHNSDDIDMYRGIRIIVNQALYMCDTQSPDGIVRLIYEESETKRYGGYYNFWATQSKIENTLGFSSVKPHIDHVKFNGPATIVFWKDGTKTVVKHDGKGRKDKRLAVLYAFIRKIYGEGKPYNNILNEIEEAVSRNFYNS